MSVRVKKPHRKYFIVVYIISYLMMLPPLCISETRRVIPGSTDSYHMVAVLGAVMTVGLIIQYQLDKRCEKAAEEQLKAQDEAAVQEQLERLGVERREGNDKCCITGSLCGSWNLCVDYNYISLCSSKRERKTL